MGQSGQAAGTRDPGRNGFTFSGPSSRGWFPPGHVPAEAEGGRGRQQSLPGTRLLLGKAERQEGQRLGDAPANPAPLCRGTPGFQPSAPGPALGPAFCIGREFPGPETALRRGRLQRLMARQPAANSPGYVTTLRKKYIPVFSPSLMLFAELLLRYGEESSGRTFSSLTNAQWGKNTF